MEKLIDFLMCSGYVALELVVIVFIMLTIQFLIYQLSNKKINIYKTIMNSKRLWNL